MFVILVNNENNECYEFEMIESICGFKVVDFFKFFEMIGFFFYDLGYFFIVGC